MVLTLSRQFVTLTGTGKAVRVFFTEQLLSISSHFYITFQCLFFKLQEHTQIQSQYLINYGTVCLADYIRYRDTDKESSHISSEKQALLPVRYKKKKDYLKNSNR